MTWTSNSVILILFETYQKQTVIMALFFYQFEKLNTLDFQIWVYEINQYLYMQ